MTTLVFGASGLIGRHLIQALRGPVARPNTKIENLDAVRRDVIHHSPLLVINCAGLASVEACQEDPNRAFAVNALGAEHVAMAAAEIGARVVHISTEYVFDNSYRQPFDEWHLPTPLSIYAQSKYAGEQLVAAANPNHQIIRLHSCYGEGGKQFLSQLPKELRSKNKAQGDLEADCDRLIQPTWAGTAAKMVIELIEKPYHGIFHVGASGKTTIMNFAEKMRMGLRSTRMIEAAPYCIAARPSILLEHRRLEMLGMFVPTWEASLDDYLRSVT